MMTYKEREDKLFVRWKAACQERDGIDPECDFCADGLLYRGDYEQPYGCWERRPGNESELWDRSNARLLILSKDTENSFRFCSIGVSKSLYSLNVLINIFTSLLSNFYFLPFLKFSFMLAKLFLSVVISFFTVSNMKDLAT
jgi:hypothetical protein